MLNNEKLTEPFAYYRKDSKLSVAQGWAPWWLEAAPGDPSWKNRTPVYGPYTIEDTVVQQLSTPFGTHTAGVLQQLPSAIGNRYELTVEGQAWSSEDAAPASQFEASDVDMQIGIDPTGGTDPESPLIIWSAAAQPLSHWESFRLVVEAESSTITIFMRSAPKLPKRQQTIFWRNARLRPIGRYKRSINIVGAGDTHITLEPDQPQPGEMVAVTVSSNRSHRFVGLFIHRPDGQQAGVLDHGMTEDETRYTWRYAFVPDIDGLYDIRFLGDGGARLFALRLLRVAREVQIVATDAARLEYDRVYVLLPPTANREWLQAAASGSFDGRYTIGFSADDAGIGNLSNRHVLAVNPHHWPEAISAGWFQQHYPGTQFTAVIANTPQDLESWLQKWTGRA